MNECPNDGFAYAEVDQQYVTNETPAFEQETDDSSDLEGEPEC